MTGGFRTTQGMNEALNSNACDVIGLGRPLCSEPNIVNELLNENKSSAIMYENILQFGPGIFGLNSSINYIKANNKASHVYWCYRQILRLADKKEVKPNMNLLGAALSHLLEDAKASKKYRNYWQDLA